MLRATPVKRTVTIFDIGSCSNRSSASVMSRDNPSDSQFSADSSQVSSLVKRVGGNQKFSLFLYLSEFSYFWGGGGGGKGPVDIESPRVTTETSSLIWHVLYIIFYAASFYQNKKKYIYIDLASVLADLPLAISLVWNLVDITGQKEAKYRW